MNVQIYQKGVNYLNITGTGEIEEQDIRDLKQNLGKTIKQRHAYVSDKELPLLKPRYISLSHGQS